MRLFLELTIHVGYWPIHFRKRKLNKNSSIKCHTTALDFQQLSMESFQIRSLSVCYEWARFVSLISDVSPTIRGLGEKRGAGVRGSGARVTGCEKRGVWWKTRGPFFFSPKYKFSSVKWEAKILLAYIAMNINSASRPETRCLIKRAN